MNKITEVTRKDIFDLLRIGCTDSSGIDVHFSWYGRLNGAEFLERLYDLASMQSYDHRYKSAGGDIYQHTVLNDDCDDAWIFGDSRFNLTHGDDETFLKFLCEMFHPVVRNEKGHWKLFLNKINELLAPDGYKLSEKNHISGKYVYDWQSLTDENSVTSNQINTVTTKFNSEYISIQVNQMVVAQDNNPVDAIGKAKELLESCCKTILESKNIAWDKDWNVQKLVKETCKSLKLTPDDIQDTVKASEIIKSILGNLAAISGGIAELRNSYGSGHGKSAKYKGLLPRHARLAVSAAVTAVYFLWQTYEEKR